MFALFQLGFYLTLFSAGRKPETVKLNFFMSFLKTLIHSISFQSFLLSSYFRDRKINYNYSDYKVEWKRDCVISHTKYRAWFM